jgi:hypothetical protein
MLPESDRKDLAIQALARSTTISDLSVRHRVSRKFVYQQAHKAGAALDEVFLSGTPEDDVLFHLTVSKTWLRQVIVALTLICRSSYRGVVEFLRDLLGDRDTLCQRLRQLGGSRVVTSGIKDALRRRSRRSPLAILDPSRARRAYEFCGRDEGTAVAAEPRNMVWLR